MNVFVVRLNPDTRDSLPYTRYPTIEEYKSIHGSSPMNGFHEAINFKSESDVVRGYLPPRHLASMRDGEPFALVTITAKTAKEGGDFIVGIQAGCKYVGKTSRVGAGNIKGLDLVWHYTCPETLSLLMDEPIPGARGIVLGKNGTWVRGPTFKLDNDATTRVFKKITSVLKTEISRNKFKAIRNLINGENICIPVSVANFDDDVNKSLKTSSNERKKRLASAPKMPAKKLVLVEQFVRNPDVIAEVLFQAEGVCQKCRAQAPFDRKSDGTPYLEVHHKTPLASGGEDTVANAIAMCPNCHREAHYG